MKTSLKTCSKQATAYQISCAVIVIPTIPDYLATADVTKPFTVTDSAGQKVYFNVVTVWEFFEHIKECDIPDVVFNIKSHLVREGFFIGSIASTPYGNWHQTIQSESWWIKTFASLGMQHASDILGFFGRNLVRLEGFPIAHWVLK